MERIPIPHTMDTLTMPPRAGRMDRPNFLGTPEILAIAIGTAEMTGNERQGGMQRPTVMATNDRLTRTVTQDSWVGFLEVRVRAWFPTHPQPQH